MSAQYTSIATQLAHGGRPEKGATGPVNTPVVRASTMLFPTVAALRAAQGSRTDYGRLATETTRALEMALCEVEGAAGCLLTPSGLSAVTTALLGLLSPGDHLLMTDTVYEPTRLFCDGTLRRLGVEVQYYDPLIGAEIAALLRPNTRVVFVESPGTATFEMQDVPAIAAVAHRHGAVVVSDSTWATPIGWRPFDLGVDVSVHAATKYIVGHSDAVLGVVLCNEATYVPLRRYHKEMGMTASSDDAYLALRGLRTLAARLAVHRQNALAVARWLAQQPEVDTVLYPPLPGSPGHDIWSRDFRAEAACGLMAVQFKPHVSGDQADRIADTTRLFGIGYSWGGFESLILPMKPCRARVVTAARSEGRALVRLHIGLEDVADLIHDLDTAFAAMRAAA